MTIEVTVQDGRESQDDEVPPSTEFKRWVDLAMSDPALDAAITIRIVDAAESRRLNRQYRNQDKPTNVLSFTYEDDELLSVTGARPQLGDLVICADVVRAEAEEKGCPPNDHWAHMTIHGVLHLLGYEHETHQQAEEMEALEKRLLASITIADPYELTH
mgnify:CR=1 FL=1